ncbi:carbohydrate ABC transporter permease [Microbacterium maritypicum]|uniref:Sugar ABC transporter permease n=1 Tax=Microbacterium maritypicum TaxID=33918 RepID=A0A4Y4BA17_MICMQ|nr:sugar ABC transporter permease [Microbacterium liquefaciens]GEC75433.1 sugar ABC transporter permease [Microbacterium liquefaciens]GGV58297.1 sugar ABC transporter permease [Microbacterium liquefaciens]
MSDTVTIVSRPVKAGSLAPRRRHRRGLPLSALLGLLVPFLVLFLLAYVLPLLYALQESFFTQKRSGLGLGGGERVFAGIANYVQALQTPEFTAGIGRVLLFGVVQVPIMLGAALLLALIFDAVTTRWTGLVRLMTFMPYAVPGVIAAILWAFLYLPGTSPFIGVLGAFGIEVDFLGDDTVLWAIANIVTWTWTGYNMIIIFSALKSIPSELYEAAAMDGASPARIAWSIKVPLVMPAISLTGVFSIIGTIQLYNEPMILKPFTSAIDAGYTPNMAVQNIGFTFNDYGLAAAMAIILALGTFVLSFVFTKVTGGQTKNGGAR